MAPTSLRRAPDGTTRPTNARGARGSAGRARPAAACRGSAGRSPEAPRARCSSRRTMVKMRCTDQRADRRAVAINLRRCLLVVASGVVGAWVGDPKTADARPAQAGRLARCEPQSLRLAFAGRLSPQTGEHGIEIRLTNRGAACQVVGFPMVRLYAGSTALPFIVERNGRYIAPAPQRHVLLRPGNHAYVLLAKYRCDGRTAAQASALGVTLPGGGPALRLALPRSAGFGDYCASSAHEPAPGNRVGVSALRALP